VAITIEEAFHGTQIDLDLNMPEYDQRGQLRRVPHAFKARIPKGATDGQRLRLPGKGGKGLHGGRDGDLYLNISLRAACPVSRHRPRSVPGSAVGALGGGAGHRGGGADAGRCGAAQGAPGTQAGRHLRLPQRGLPKPKGGQGDLYAIVQIVVPSVVAEPERELYRKLADGSSFDPRAHFAEEAGHAH
jgi:curved DNA-binding protein